VGSVVQTLLPYTATVKTFLLSVITSLTVSWSEKIEHSQASISIHALCGSNRL